MLAPHVAASRLRAARSTGPVAHSPSTPPGLELPSTVVGTMSPSPYLRCTLLRRRRQAGQRPPRSRGSSTSRSASPSMLKPKRSEEHTSELQSQSNLVCRLLLEKKKTSYTSLQTHSNTKRHD